MPDNNALGLQICKILCSYIKHFNIIKNLKIKDNNKIPEVSQVSYQTNDQVPTNRKVYLQLSSKHLNS